MTTKIAARGAVCILMCVVIVSFTACVRPKGNLAHDSDGEIRAGEEFLIKEEKIDAKYIRNICKRARWIYDADLY